MTSSGPVLVSMTRIEKRFGRNGAGKSTVVSILSGLADPDAGTVRFAGAPAPRAGDVARWREWIATVFQHSPPLPPPPPPPPPLPPPPPPPPTPPPLLVCLRLCPLFVRPSVFPLFVFFPPSPSSSF